MWLKAIDLDGLSFGSVTVYYIRYHRINNGFNYTADSFIVIIMQENRDFKEMNYCKSHIYL